MSLSSSFRRSFPVCRCGLLLAAFAAAPALASPITVTFDDALGGGAAAGWNEAGYRLAFNGADSMVGSGAGACNPQCPEDGSQYLLSWGGSLSITPTRSRVFSLSSFDAAEPSAGWYGKWAQYIDVTGVKGDGSTLTQRFAIDAIRDSDRAAAEFRTFTLGADFQDLRSVSLRNGGTGAVYALDNIRLSDVPAAAAAVPEPGTLALVAAALLAACAGSRRRPSARRTGG